tara:strand:- start:328 stop:549 length:222 start_codon:yes stop_codon:yes gene_type:complete
MAKFKLVQKQHSGKGPYYRGDGRYFGFACQHVGEDLFADAEKDAIQSHLDAGNFEEISKKDYDALVKKHEVKD